MAQNGATSVSTAAPEITHRPSGGAAGGGEQRSHVQLKRKVAATEGYDAQMALLAPGGGGGGAPGPVQKQDAGKSKGWLESIGEFFGFGGEQEEETETTDPELEAFLNTNIFGPKDLQAPSGLGGFSATYDASAGALAIEVRGTVSFTDGLVDQGGVVTANHPDLQTAADAANTITDPADKALFMADFLWAGNDTGAWLTQMQTNVQNTWSNQHAFFVDKPGWEKVVAGVSMTANIRAGAQQATDHVGVTVYKVPDDGSWDVGAVVNSNSNTPHGHGMVLGSRDNRNAEQRSADGDGGLLNWSISEFESGSAALTGDMQAQVTTFCNNFLDAGNDNSNPVTITGRASADGAKADNERLATARAEAVAEALKAGGVTAVRLTTEVAGEDGATADTSWRRVDLKVGDGRAQDVAAHEFGHVLGLGDYYDDAGNGRGGSITGTGQPAGTVTAHDQCAKDIGISGGAVHENNDGLMSLGTNVKPADYATIGWALQDVTGRREWRIRQ